MKIFISGIIGIVLIVGVFFLFIFSGIYNIGATSPHYKFTRWVISKITDNSIKHYSKEVAEPPNLSDTSLVKTGFVHYRQMCSGCHGAPGINRNEIAEGLYPKPPRTSKIC